MKINHSFQINSLLKMSPPTLLGELFRGGKNLKVKNDHKSFTTQRFRLSQREHSRGDKQERIDLK
jgi:hypothetical protein